MLELAFSTIMYPTFPLLIPVVSSAMLFTNFESVYHLHRTNKHHDNVK